MIDEDGRVFAHETEWGMIELNIFDTNPKFSRIYFNFHDKSLKNFGIPISYIDSIIDGLIRLKEESKYGK